jgi:hypothetical protein
LQLKGKNDEQAQHVFQITPRGQAFIRAAKDGPHKNPILGWLDGGVSSA